MDACHALELPLSPDDPSDEGRSWQLLPHLSPRELPAAEVPEPYQRLLVHERDMTSTLETFHGERMLLRTLVKEQWARCLRRRVVLVGEASGRPAEFGSIHIELDRFEPAARAEILTGRRPLGALLAAFEVPYLSRPQSFFRVRADLRTANALQLPTAGTVLYGRRNLLLTPAGELLAEVVEILPPRAPAHS